MKPLTTKYRPHKLTELVGQGQAVKSLALKLKAKQSFAAILYGEPGIGKTSAAYALAAELGCDADGSEAQRFSTGFVIVPSNRQGVDSLDEIFDHCRYRPMYGGNWWVILLEESECKSRQAVNYLKTRLEMLPKQTIVLFTTNSDLADFADKAIAERCLCLKFEHDAAALWDDAQRLVDRVWMTELGHNHSPTLADLGFSKTGRLSFRQVIKAVEPLILAELPAESDEIAPQCPPPVCNESTPAPPAPEPPAAIPEPLPAVLQPEPVIEPPPAPVKQTWQPAIGQRVTTGLKYAGSLVCGEIKNVRDGLYQVGGFWFSQREIKLEEGLL